MTGAGPAGSALGPPRAGLVIGPTPLERWSNLSRALGAPILAKRDDVSVLGLGGNKVRKLDLILGDAIRNGVTDIVTAGGVQSNHCRLAAAACARLGLGCHVFLRGDDPFVERAGNLLLDELFGASVQIHDVASFDDLVAPMARHAKSLQSAGKTPLVVPLGGTTPLGTLAYVLAARELREQLPSVISAEEKIARLIVAAGTGGTAAGIALGCSLYLPDAVVVAVSVSRTSSSLAVALREYHAEAAGVVPSEAHMDNLQLVTDHVGAGYTIPNPGTGEAVRLLARNEGVLSDLTYTGKALEYLVSQPAAAGGSSGSTLFWHTGGAPELFARPAHDVLGAADGAFC